MKRISLIAIISLSFLALSSISNTLSAQTIPENKDNAKKEKKHKKDTENNDSQVKTTNSKLAYHIVLKMPDIKQDSMMFLVHYYGKGLPTIYKKDSAIIKNGKAEFKSYDSTFIGGIYMMLLADHKTNFEFLLNSGDDMTITATLNKMDTAPAKQDGPCPKQQEPVSLKFKNSPENDRFLAYVDFLKDYGCRQQILLKELAAAKNASDTSAVRKKGTAQAKELVNYRRKYVKENSGTLLSSIFNALEVPEVPEGDHFLEDGKTKDSTFPGRYYKAHYWDGFDLQDERLIHTPILDAKLDEYMSKWVLPIPDSVEHECDMLLKRARGTKDIFKYTLWWLTRYVENSKIMGMDEAFVYLGETYYMKGDAFWLTNEELEKYIGRIKKISPNVIGNLAPEIKLNDVLTKKNESMLNLKCPYTLLVFYSPTCGHCQHEIPELDSLYEAVLKDKGVKVYTVATDATDEKVLTDFLKKYKMEKWINTWDPEHTGDWRGKYDVYSTPTIYLMDEKKIIRGKRLDHSNIGSVIEMREKRAKADKEKADKAKK